MTDLPVSQSVLVGQSVCFSNSPKSEDLHKFYPQSISVDSNRWLEAPKCWPYFWPAVAKCSWLSREAHHPLDPFLQLHHTLDKSIALYLFSILPGLILIAKFSLINAKSVVVKYTFPSSSTGIFMRINFL